MNRSAPELVVAEAAQPVLGEGDGTLRCFGRVAFGSLLQALPVRGTGISMRLLSFFSPGLPAFSSLYFSEAI
jgi:hypothetical protein